MYKGHLMYQLMVRTLVEAGEFTAFNDFWKVAPPIRAGRESGIPSSRMREIIADISKITVEEIESLARHFELPVKKMQQLVKAQLRIQKRNTH